MMPSDECPFDPSKLLHVWYGHSTPDVSQLKQIQPQVCSEFTEL